MINHVCNVLLGDAWWQTPIVQQMPEVCWLNVALMGVVPHFERLLQSGVIKLETLRC